MKINLDEKGWQYCEELIYLRPIFRLAKLAFHKKGQSYTEREYHNGF